MPTEEELQRGFKLGDWEVLPDEGVIRSGDVEVHPEPQTWRVLLVLARNDGKLVTKEDLVADVWGGRAVADDPINRAIREVRKSLGDSAHDPKFVATLHKRGYRLLVPVELNEPEQSSPVTPEPGPSLRLWRIVAAILAIGFVAIVAFTWILPSDPPVRSIAVMPFENLSGADTDEYLVSGFKEELVQTLHSIDDFTVKNGRVNYEKELPEIAELLQVESVLFGTLRREGDALKISYQISTSSKGIVHSGDIEGDVDDLFSLQESLAVMVRDSLVGKSTQTLIKSRPSDSVAYDSYMLGMYALEHRPTPGKMKEGIELFKKAIELDAQYGPSYLGLATLYALIPSYEQEPYEKWHRLALETIEAGIEADPAIEDAAGAIYGYVYHNEKRWVEAEEAYLEALKWNH